MHKLLFALGKESTGAIEGINLAETSAGFGVSGGLFPKGFSSESYTDAITTNMKALRQAFPKSVVMQYANFMPGEWRPREDKGYLRAGYKAAQELKVGVGGPRSVALSARPTKKFLPSNQRSCGRSSR
jgi:hypothetical protein